MIYMYSIAFGTNTSRLIKEEYNRLIHMRGPTILRPLSANIGFMGYKTCMNIFLYTRFVDATQYKQIQGDHLLPEQLYEIEDAKIFYLYHFSNENRFRIMFIVKSNEICLQKLVKYKIMKLNSEEE
jgi:hypothetical protein